MMVIQISIGAEFERLNEAGELENLTPQQMAATAFIGNTGEYFVPQMHWVKDFPGQVTHGRIGRPAIRYCPVSWLPSKIGDEVKVLISSAGAGGRDA